MTPIKPLDLSYSADIQSHIDQKTKPLGALGQLEDVAAKLALIASNKAGVLQKQVTITKPTAVVFAGDHGIAEQGVSIAPSAVTGQMVLNFLAGGAAINCFCAANQIDLHVVDCGILSEVATDNPNFHQQRLGQTTFDLSTQPAMATTQVEQGLALGANLALSLIDNGCDLILFGEMGIGNTSSASALLALLTDNDAQAVVGLGTGISTEQLNLKQKLVQQAIDRVKTTGNTDITKLLAEVGGFEIVQIVGAMLAAAEKQIPILVDGFIVSVAALVASKMDKQVTDYFIFAHQSQEQAHQLCLTELNAKPLLSLQLRLGEGTGAALAVPLLKSACHFYSHMASFADAGVTV
ncbi:nicotinate-nucleotide--dimethylbenzimidazole phosphoribosyltransferase [Saccharobesus litoralis]|uniref:Nicotinate-nucleotide--dimethylbenzimidazole phosphoribosyltransferase n=2 Tax=Saccharobesus litoralis TaxID=2172099 RepID=A0A2S0VLX4_9ALTE|nr:nicotinate-nucleotide--dimethylbenzimidazole phosphoribosyltransferase [Saccharobesus litoralis]